MSVFDTDQIVTLAEVLSILIGIGITWAVYYGSERAELPDLTVGGMDVVAAVFLLLGRQQDRDEVYFSPEHRAGR